MRRGYKILAFCVLSMLLFNAYAYSAAVSYITVRPAAAIERTPLENTFRLEGNANTFILLDHNEEGFFVMSRDYYGLHVYDPDNTGKFDIADPNNMAYWLNHEFLEEGNLYNGNTYQLPTGIKKHLVERDWLCEAGFVTTDYNEDYMVRAKVALMSLTEYKKYLSKFGFADDASSNYYYLRSVNGTSSPGVNSGIMVVFIQDATTVSGKAFNPYGVRPVFYLDRNFFISERMEMSALGDNVSKTLREVYTKKELSYIYSAQEIGKIYKKLPPQATKVKMSGIPQVGKTLTGSYQYFSPENMPEGKSDYRWLRAKSKLGPFSIILGENALTYQLKTEDAGYYVLFEVVPKSLNQIGRASRSAMTLIPIEAASAPYAENVYIDGEAADGEKLIARYSYNDDNDDIEDGTQIRWQSSSDGVTFEDIPEAVGLNWTVSPEVEGQYIRFVVEVKNKEALGAGTPVASEKIGPVRVFPKVNPAQITLNGDRVTLSTGQENGVLILWETAGENGQYIPAQLGGSEYRLLGSEQYVRVRSVSMLSGVSSNRSAYSNVVSVTGLPIESGNAVTTMNIEGSRTVHVRAAKGSMAYAISFKLICDGVTIEKISSEKYQALTSQKDGNILCVLIGTGLFGALVPEIPAQIEVSGKGSLKITDIEAVYRTADGSSMSTALTLSLE